jgi:hypothetical protein
MHFPFLFSPRSLPFIAATSGGAAAHAASVTFRCPLCGLGATAAGGGLNAATPASIAAAWASSAALAFSYLAPSTHGAPAIANVRRDANDAREEAIAAAIGEMAQEAAAAAASAAAAQDANVAVSEPQAAQSPELARLTDAISAATAAWAAHGGDAAPADGGVGGWLAGIIAATSEHAAQMHADASAETSASSHGLPDGGAGYVRGVALSGAAMDALEVEAIAVVAESFAAARRFGSDPAIPTVALASLAARLAEAYSVPVRVTTLAQPPPLHIREAIEGARHEDWSLGPRPPRVWAVVLLTLAAVAVVALVAAGGAALWRRRKAAAAAAGGAGGGGASVSGGARKLKRKTSDFFPDSAAAVGGGSVAATRASASAGAPAAAMGTSATLPGVCEVHLGTPGSTPRSGGATPRSARGARGDGAA